MYLQAVRRAVRQRMLQLQRASPVAMKIRIYPTADLQVIVVLLCPVSRFSAALPVTVHATTFQSTLGSRACCLRSKEGCRGPEICNNSALPVLDVHCGPPRYRDRLSFRFGVY